MQISQVRPWLRADEAKVGMEIEHDGESDCWTRLRYVLEVDSQGRLWFPCERGKHYLDGQTSADGVYCVGVYKADSHPKADPRMGASYIIEGTINGLRFKK